MKKDKNKRRSRRGLAVFLCLLALAPALALSARAADVDIMFSDPVVMVGETATVNVYSTADIAGVSMTLVYDTDLLTYTGASGGLGNASVLDNGGTLTIVDYHSTGTGRLSLNLSFSTRAAGTAVLYPTACTVSNAGGDLMSVEYSSHSSAITVRSASGNCDLSALYIDPGTLSPAFSSGNTNYSVTVPNSATWLAVSPVKSDDTATYSIAGNGWLNVGLNYVTVTVTAGNGNQKTYTLAVTRQPAEAQEPDNTVDDTPEEEPLYVTAPDGSQMEIGTFTAQQIPGGFSGTEITFRDHTVSAILSADGTRTGVYCRGNDSNPEGFYALDVQTGAAAPMDVLTLAAASYVVLDASLSPETPAGCTPGRYATENGEYSAFLPQETGAEYVVLYAVSPQGTAGLYRYDTQEGTIQRYRLGASGSVTVSGGYTILDPILADSPITPPEGCSAVRVDIGGESVSVYAPQGNADAGWCVVYAQAPDGSRGLYVYDRLEGTFQRWGLTASADPGGSVVQDTEQELLEAQERINSLKWQTAVFGVSAAVLLAAGIVMAILLFRGLGDRRRTGAGPAARREEKTAAEEFWNRKR